MTEYLTVSTLTKYLKTKFERDPYLEKVYLTGEISNFRKRPSHQYFSLKDDSAVISVTMFAPAFNKLNFLPENGMKVMVVGRISLYEKSGQYQINVTQMIPDGIGALAVKFEQLKEKLTSEGLFNMQWKQDIPQFSKKIGVVTSPSGAVIRDIITTVGRRFPMTEIVLFPTKVQGDGAAEEIATNIRRANDIGDFDVLIVGRGGGSIEDLWCFNEESVVRAIFESKIPVISSVGHETDTTLADYVADRRAATPTAAAEIATPVSQFDILTALSDREKRMEAALLKSIRLGQERVDRLVNSVIFRQPERLYDGHIQKVDLLTNQLIDLTKQNLRQKSQTYELLNQRLSSINLLRKVNNYQDLINQEQRLLVNAINKIYDQKKNQAERAWQALTLISPEKILSRGYAVVKKDDMIVKSTDDVFDGDILEIDLADGRINVEVKNK
ncbi:exodeoxyribonuclease VII large subunit [Floricoccus penangensis]|uniref:Exodeoxyribonuclease 7 large subunit n=1 Tax=Floricoccus penangensis TaxID=1859475 RepID=A0A9Q5P0G9_9LACT|nr:exodeoxyribonuclease VII large subunit [Floricoccus penangensis]OFI47756.1 exodeoxyribonuclease VII large subunit [Floricoccus penangensis]